MCGRSSAQKSKIKSNRGNALTVQGARLRAFLRLCLRDAAHAWTSASPHSPLTATEERAERPRLARALFVPNRIRKIEQRRFIKCRSRASKVYRGTPAPDFYLIQVQDLLENRTAQRTPADFQATPANRSSGTAIAPQAIKKQATPNHTSTPV